MMGKSAYTVCSTSFTEWGGVEGVLHSPEQEGLGTGATLKG